MKFNVVLAELVNYLDINNFDVKADIVTVAKGLGSWSSYWWILCNEKLQCI